MTNSFVEQLSDLACLDMVEIPAGSFLMGSPPDEPGRYNDEGPQHEVTLGAFFMSRTLITQAQWRAVAQLPKVGRDLLPEPTYFRGDDLPVEQVSWHDAIEFCRRLSQHTGRNYTLPSEAQWEYACRAGTTTPFHFGATITPELANYDGSINRAETTPVGTFPANDWGLYDMHGNAWEWCLDDWHDNYAGAPADGSAWVEGFSLGKSSEVDRGTSPGTSPGTAARPATSETTRTPAITMLGSVSATEDNGLGKCNAAARGTSTPGTAARPTATGTTRTPPASTLGSVSVATEIDSPGKCSGAARGTTPPGLAARPAATFSTRATAAAKLGSVSAAEIDSLGKSSKAARGSAPPGAAAQPAAAGTSRTTSTTMLGSVSASPEDNSLGKSCAAARGSTTPGAAARPAAAGAARSPASTALGSVSVAEGLKPLRGGSWDDLPGFCRSASRDWLPPDYRGYLVGFRVCCLPHV